MLAHTLGNPFNLEAVCTIAREHDLLLIEDCCDAFGATYNDKEVGTFGDLATLSFYPAHQITMGEGGAVMTNSKKLASLVESFPRLGSRLLVSTRSCQHLQKKIRLAIGRSAERLRP